MMELLRDQLNGTALRTLPARSVRHQDPVDLTSERHWEWVQAGSQPGGQSDQPPAATQAVMCTGRRRQQDAEQTAAAAVGNCRWVTETFQVRAVCDQLHRLATTALWEDEAV